MIGVPNGPIRAGELPVADATPSEAMDLMASEVAGSGPPPLPANRSRICRSTPSSVLSSTPGIPATAPTTPPSAYPLRDRPLRNRLLMA
ncbi:Uncharacterised protein [Mycobacteroides abscessus subsp. abscessus]|nr:Uncharacterised protein [Mycobacteroides abscessus subsp. abscessus]